ncbi:MAG: class I SAM-dependent methyltransferase [Myxococcales bacterium]
MASANLPILNWFAGSAHDVRTQIVTQYEALMGAMPRQITDFRLTRDGKVELVGLTGGKYPKPPEVVVLALGFGIERTLPTLPRLSYWQMDALAQHPLETLDKHTKLLICGDGDGGAVDFLRATLVNFDHGPFLDHACSILEPVRTTIVDLEWKVAEAGGNEHHSLDRSALVFEKYGLLKTSWKDLDEFLESNLRPGIDVTWRGRSPNPMSFRTQPLHRLLAWRVLRVSGGRFRYEQGEPDHVVLLDQTRREGPLYLVTFRGEGIPRAFHRVVCRTGGESPLAKHSPKLHSALLQRQAGAADLESERLRPEAAEAITGAAHKAIPPAPAGSFRIVVEAGGVVDDCSHNGARLYCRELKLWIADAPDDVDEVTYWRRSSSGYQLLRRALRGHEKKQPFRVSLFTWDDYHVEVRLSNGDRTEPRALSSLLKGAQAKSQLKGTAKLLAGNEALATVLRQRAHRDRASMLVKERNLEAGLVQSLFLPCARELLNACSDLSKPRYILDAGCGSGIVARVAADKFRSAAIHGFDSSRDAIRVAHEVRGARKIEYAVNDVLKVQAAQRYDVIFAQHLIQHLGEHAGTALARLHDLLEPSGRLVVGVWTQDSPAYAAIYEACGESVKTKTMGMTSGALRSMLESAGFQQVELRRSRPRAEEPLHTLVRQYLHGSIRWLRRGYRVREELASTCTDGSTPHATQWIATARRA